MNSVQITKYIDNRLKKIVDDKMKAFEQSIMKNYNSEKTYELKNPILHKHFIIND